MADILPLSAITGATVVPIADVVEGMMAIKSPAEVTLLRESARWSDAAQGLLQRYTRVGVSETEAALCATSAARRALSGARGSRYRAQSSSYDGPTAYYRGQIGRRAAIPHALPFQPIRMHDSPY